MTPRQSPESTGSAPSSSLKSAAGSKLAALLVAVSGMTAANTASALDCPKGQHTGVTATVDGGTKAVCVDDVTGVVVKAKAAPKSVPVCRIADIEDQIQVRSSQYAPMTDVSTVMASTESKTLGKFFMKEGQAMSIVVHCLDTYNGGKKEVGITDSARKLAVARSQIKVTVNGNIVTPQIFADEGQNVVIHLPLQGPQGESQDPVEHRVVVEAGKDQVIKTALVGLNNHEEGQDKGIADAKAAAKKAQETAEANKPAPVVLPSAPTPVAPPAPAPVAPPVAPAAEAGEVDGTLEVEGVAKSLLGEGTTGAGLNVNLLFSTSKTGSAGVGFGLERTDDRKMVIEGQEVKGAKSTVFKAGLEGRKAVSGVQLAAKAGVLGEFFDKTVYKDKALTGENGVGAYAEAALKFVVEMTKKTRGHIGLVFGMTWSQKAAGSEDVGLQPYGGVTIGFAADKEDEKK